MSLLSDAETAQGKENVIRMIVHELCNPLTSISLANQSLAEITENNEEALTSVKLLTSIIARNINRIESLLKDLLNINTEEGQQLSPTDICHVIDKSLDRAADRILLNKAEVQKYTSITVPAISFMVIPKCFRLHSSILSSMLLRLLKRRMGNCG